MCIHVGALYLDDIKRVSGYQYHHVACVEVSQLHRFKSAYLIWPLTLHIHPHPHQECILKAFVFDSKQMKFNRPFCNSLLHLVHYANTLSCHLNRLGRCTHRPFNQKQLLYWCTVSFSVTDWGLVSVQLETIDHIFLHKKHM